MLLLFCTACAPDPVNDPADPARTGIDLNDPGQVRITDLSSDPPLPDEAKNDAPAAPRKLIVSAVLFDSASPRLRIALDMLDGSVFGWDKDDTLRANGVRVGVLKRDEMPLLWANLGRPITEKVFKIHNARVYNPITLVSRIDPRVRVRFVDATGHAQRVRFAGGEYRMMFRMDLPESAGEPVRLDILPHRFLPRPSLFVRTQQEQIMQGDSFIDLALGGMLRSDEVWILTAHLAAPDPDAEPIPRSARAQPIGHAMLTGVANGRRVQLFLLIGLERSPSVQTPDANPAPTQE